MNIIIVHAHLYCIMGTDLYIMFLSLLGTCDATGACDYKNDRSRYMFGCVRMKCLHVFFKSYCHLWKLLTKAEICMHGCRTTVYNMKMCPHPNLQYTITYLHHNRQKHSCIAVSVSAIQYSRHCRAALTI